MLNSKRNQAQKADNNAEGRGVLKGNGRALNEEDGGPDDYREQQDKDDVQACHGHGVIPI